MKTVVSTNNTKTALPAAVTILPNKVEPIVTESQSQMPFSIPDANTLIAGNSKRPASLDLNKTTQGKKPRLVTPLLLDSPDLQNMKTLNTPDLEKILLSSNMLQTPQPGTVFPTKVGQITSEQEAFGKGFEEALHSLHNSKNAQANNVQTVNNTIVSVSSTTSVSSTAVTGMSGGSFTYTNLDTTFPISIKDEPQNPSSSPPVSPIDMETQEKIKLERKRQRNRVAASKCRKRKLERISKLEDKVKNLKTENGELGSVVKGLKDHVAQLKEQVMEHLHTGCNLPTIYSTILMGGK